MVEHVAEARKKPSGALRRRHAPEPSHPVVARARRAKARGVKSIGYGVKVRLFPISRHADQWLRTPSLGFRSRFFRQQFGGRELGRSGSRAVPPARGSPDRTASSLRP